MVRKTITAKPEACAQPEKKQVKILITYYHRSTGRTEHAMLISRDEDGEPWYRSYAHQVLVWHGSRPDYMLIDHVNFTTKPLTESDACD